MSNQKPELYDEVKHKKNETAGTVIAKYKIGETIYLDVRGTEDKIFYKTPAKNWTVTQKYVP